MVIEATPLSIQQPTTRPTALPVQSHSVFTLHTIPVDSAAAAIVAGADDAALPTTYIGATPVTNETIRMKTLAPDKQSSRAPKSNAA